MTTEQARFDAELRAWLARQRDEMRARYQRVLPTGETLFNRFEKAEYLGMGEGSSIYDTSVVMGDVAVGAHCWIGPYTLLEGLRGRLTLGDWVSVDAGSVLYTHDSTRHYVTGGKAPFQQGDVSIGSCTVIGTLCMVACGVTIGRHCVVAAQSFVNRDVPDYTIVAGVPARPIGRVVMEADGADARFEYFHEGKEKGEG